MTPGNSAGQLVNGFAASATTEDLIIFVAGTDNLLTFCRDLIEQYDQNPHAPQVLEVNTLCATRGLLPGELFAEVRKVLLALNRFHDAGGNHYATLGLKQSASRDEVKHAFRALSKKHHPDKLQGSDKGSRRFMEISGAYHAIMAGSVPRTSTQPKAWRNTRRNTSQGGRHRDRSRFFIGLGVTVVILAGTSIFLAARYHNRINAGRMRQMRLYDTRAPKAAKPAAQATSLAEVLARAATNETGPGPAALQPEASTGPAPSDALPMETTGTEPPATMPMPRPTPVPDLIRVEDLKPAATGQIVHNKDSVSQVSSAALPAAETLPRPKPVEKVAKITKQTKAEQQAHARKIAAFNSSLEINTMIREFSILYSRRDLAPFLNLFSDQATENGEPLTEVREQYRSLFAHTRSIDLAIAEINWQPGESESYQARGAFTVSYTYNDNRTHTHHGTINFDLIHQDNRLKIKALNYTFD